jgi:hypothetical protein
VSPGLGHEHSTPAVFGASGSFGVRHWEQGPWSWHLAHVVAVWLLLIAIHEVLGRRRWALIGFILGLLFAIRPTAGLIVMFFAGLLVLLGEGKTKTDRSRFGSAAHLFEHIGAQSVQVALADVGSWKSSSPA